MPDLPPITDEQDQAIRSAIAAYAGHAIVTRYVIVAEAVQSDGEPSLAQFESPSLSAWDSIGMLRSATAAAEYAFAEVWNHE